MANSDVFSIDLASVDHVLNTTRSVRLRIDLEREVPRHVIEECLNIALQAPTGANTQTWRFMVITDAEKKAVIADAYRRGAEQYIGDQTGMVRTGVSANREFSNDDLRTQQKEGVMTSSLHLMEHMHEVPVMIIPCIESRFEDENVFEQASMYGSILPATWSLMLALRARRLATAWTTLHLLFEADVREALGMPDNITQTALLPIGYLTGGDLHKAKRLPLSEVGYWDTWGTW